MVNFPDVIECMHIQEKTSVYHTYELWKFVKFIVHIIENGCFFLSPQFNPENIRFHIEKGSHK